MWQISLMHSKKTSHFDDDGSRTEEDKSSTQKEQREKWVDTKTIIKFSKQVTDYEESN